MNNRYITRKSLNYYHTVLNHLPKHVHVCVTMRTLTTTSLIIIWALARAPNLHSNIHKSVKSSNNSTYNKPQKFQEDRTVPTNFQPGHKLSK